MKLKLLLNSMVTSLLLILGLGGIYGLFWGVMVLGEEYVHRGFGLFIAVALFIFLSTTIIIYRSAEDNS